MISVENLSVHLGNFSLSGISFEVPTGDYGILMGRTGSGKTTILEILCGLRTMTSGTVRLMGRDVSRLKAAERGIGYVPQDCALFPHMTVRQHLSFALTIRQTSKSLIEERILEMSQLLGIGHLLDRWPAGLSGGEQQRVSLGRALAFHPDILCLDEPLSALDEETREEMYDLLKVVREQTGVTALHITHSLSEARRLADHVFVIRDGRIALKNLDDGEPLVKVQETRAQTEQKTKQGVPDGSDC